MPRALSALLLAMLATPAIAQDGDGPQLRWQARVLPVAGDTGRVDVVLSSPIAPGWIVYASGFDAPEFGPRPATLTLDAAPGIQAEDGVQALQPLAGSARNAAGEYHYRYFSGQARFQQRLKRQAGATEASGILRGQACFEQSGLCTLFKHPFRVAL